MKRNSVIKSIQSASMVPFGSEFPDVALSEVRRIIAKGKRDIPDGEYLFLDSYCDDPDCDCRRVMVNVVSRDDPRNILATINYGWESVEFYKKFMHSDEKVAEYAIGAALDILNFQSDLAPAFLKAFEQILTRSYIETLEEHYKMFKQAIREKQTVRSEVKNKYGRKIGRNDPCPCGSGKKYKKCCGKEI
jgi:hypothetical protein